MVRGRKNSFDGLTPKQRANGERMARLWEQDKRRKCDLMGFWRDCQHPRCRRNHTCSGDDPEECFRQNWSLISEDWKEWVRGAIQAGLDGVTSIEELGRAADKRRAEYFELVEKHAAMFKAAARLEPAARPEPETEPASAPPPERGPRIRGL